MSDAHNIAKIQATFTYDGEAGIVSRNGKPAGYKSSAGYICISFCGRQVRAHQIAWAITHGVWPTQDIDHINGVRDDNRIVNLRLATRSQNMMNATKVRKNTSSKFKGVYFHRGCNRWRASITLNGQIRSLGNFETEEMAAQAYAAAAKSTFGDFARPVCRGETKGKGA